MYFHFRIMDLVTAGCFSLICVFFAYAAYAVPSSVRSFKPDRKSRANGLSLHKRRIQVEARRTKAKENRDGSWITHTRQRPPRHLPAVKGEKMHSLNLDHHIVPYTANAPLFMYLCAAGQCDRRDCIDVQDLGQQEQGDGQKRRNGEVGSKIAEAKDKNYHAKYAETHGD
jgi:hypothetical protein